MANHKLAAVAAADCDSNVGGNDNTVDWNWFLLRWGISGTRYFVVSTHPQTLTSTLSLRRGLLKHVSSNKSSRPIFLLFWSRSVVVQTLCARASFCPPQNLACLRSAKRMSQQNLHLCVCLVFATNDASCVCVQTFGNSVRCDYGDENCVQREVKLRNTETMPNNNMSFTFCMVSREQIMPYAYDSPAKCTIENSAFGHMSRCCDYDQSHAHSGIRVRTQLDQINYLFRPHSERAI